MPRLGELALVVLEAQVGEQARVHGGVQRAHAAVEVLGVAGDARRPA